MTFILVAIRESLVPRAKRVSTISEISRYNIKDRGPTV